MILEGCTEGKNTTQTIIDILQQTTINKINRAKVERIYEDDDWVIDRVGDNIRVSYFEDCHYVDEIIITKEQFK